MWPLNYRDGRDIFFSLIVMGEETLVLWCRVPHIFEFLEDNVMIEWWDCDFQSWYDTTSQTFHERHSHFKLKRVYRESCSLSTLVVFILSSQTW